MTEAYLHFIWKLKRLPFHQIQTTKGKEIFILNSGVHNISEAGPDFFNARIAYDNIVWAGQIEMHIKSSDWYRHGHQTDKLYENVILHVVYEHDQEVLINGATLPTIELKNFIDKEHYSHWERFAKTIKEIPCEGAIQNIDSVFLKTTLHRCFTDRLDRKINQLLYVYGDLDDQSILYNLLASAFGAKINVVPFELLTRQVPFIVLKRINKSAQKQILLKASGLYDQIKEPIVPIDFAPIPPHLWKRKGVRPMAFPEKRILQFTELVVLFDFKLLTEHLSPKDARTYVLSLVKQLNNDEKRFFSEKLLNQLFINAFLPYYWLKSIRTEDENLKELTISFIEDTPAENNHIMRKWNRTGIYASNAYESQALIELYNEYCSFKKCLNCQVGTKILTVE